MHVAYLWSTMDSRRYTLASLLLAVVRLLPANTMLQGERTPDVAQAEVVWSTIIISPIPASTTSTHPYISDLSFGWLVMVIGPAAMLSLLLGCKHSVAVCLLRVSDATEQCRPFQHTHMLLCHWHKEISSVYVKKHTATALPACNVLHLVATNQNPATATSSAANTSIQAFQGDRACRRRLAALCYSHCWMVMKAHPISEHSLDLT